MNNFERELLASGLTIKKMPKLSKYHNVLSLLSRNEKILWLNEQAKKNGYKVFGSREVEELTRKSGKEIKRIMEKLIREGKLS